MGSSQWKRTWGWQYHRGPLWELEFATPTPCPSQQSKPAPQAHPAWGALRPLWWDHLSPPLMLFPLPHFHLIVLPPSLPFPFQLLKLTRTPAGPFLVPSSLSLCTCLKALWSHSRSSPEGAWLIPCALYRWGSWGLERKGTFPRSNFK